MLSAASRLSSATNTCKSPLPPAGAVVASTRAARGAGRHDHGTRQAKHELAAAPESGTRGFDRAAMKRDQTPHESQAYAEAALGTVDRGFDLREHGEHLGE